MNSIYTKGGLFTRATVKQNPDEQTDLSKVSLWGAQTYINHNVVNAQKKKLFGDSLRRQLADRLQRIDNLQFYQLVSKFNFLVHPAQLPAPFIISLIAQQLDVHQSQKVTIKSLQQMNPDVLQDMIYRALHQSIAYSQPYLSKAMQYWYQMTNASRKQDTSKQSKVNKSYFGEKNSLLGIIGRGLDATIKGMKTVYEKSTGAIKNAGLSLWQYLVGIADVNPDFANKFAEATSKLKQYGKFLIDGWFVQNNALRTFIEGDVYYIVPSFQQLRFRIKGSFLQIYTVRKGQMKKIPQVQFDQKFLKSILKARVAEQNVQILRDYRLVRNPIEGYNASVTAFNDTYMNPTKYKAQQKSLQTKSDDIFNKTGVRFPKTGEVTLKSLQQYIINKNRSSTYKLTGIGQQQLVVPGFIETARNVVSNLMSKKPQPTNTTQTLPNQQSGG